jgi:predicted aspartyl protease
MPHPYGVDYNPPFPLLPVALFHPESGTGTEEIPAFVDTGADGTLAPARYLAAIHAEEMYSTRMRSHWGESRLARIYLVDLEIAGLRLPGVEVVADDQGENVLLGRNVLNRLIILLDGPAGTTDVLTRRPQRF